MDILVIFSFFLSFALAKITIRNMEVPESVEIGTSEPIILDCDFDSGGDYVTEIIWYFNTNYTYQWIPGTNQRGQIVANLFKNHIDVNYKVSNDQNTMHRALHIINPIRELSGNYTCKISGIDSEDSLTKRMIFYEAADSGLNLTIAENASAILCNAEGIYPEPKMNLYITYYNESEVIFEEDADVINMDENGYYNISSSLHFNPEDFTKSFTYICELEIPGTNYRLVEKGTYFLEFYNNETNIEEESYFYTTFNSTNSTESSFEELQETQIEEEIDFNTTTPVETLLTNNMQYEDTAKKGGGSSHPYGNPGLFLVTFFVVVNLLNL